MLLVENTSLDPYFNIAAEEYLLKHFDSNIAMLWRSKPSIIVGKHQNTLAEVNLGFVRQHNLPVVRRLSGGGTVFHDPGNINFTFIKAIDREKLVDFRLHTQPVIDFLNTLGLDARFEGKNDIRVNGFKISGNAEHIYKNRVLHHGTLLFDANLDHLNKAIKSREENFTSKAVKSVRSTVANINSLLHAKMERDEFFINLSLFLKSKSEEIQEYQFDPGDIRNIEKIRDEKYKGWEWNFGYSPRYSFQNHKQVMGRDILITLSVEKGRITRAKMGIDSIDQSSSMLLQTLIGQLHRPDSIERILQNCNFMGYNQTSDRWKLLGLFF